MTMLAVGHASCGGRALVAEGAPSSGECGRVFDRPAAAETEELAHCLLTNHPVDYHEPWSLAAKELFTRDAEPLLAKVVADRREPRRTRETAMTFLVELRAWSTTIPLLVDLLENDPDASFRAYVARTLGQIDSQDDPHDRQTARAALRRALADDDPAVREAAAEALCVVLPAAPSPPAVDAGAPSSPAAPLPHDAGATAAAPAVDASAPQPPAPAPLPTASASGWAPGLAAADRAEIVRVALHMALVDRRLPDFAFLPEPTTIVVSTENLPSPPPRLRGIRLVPLTPAAIQARANRGRPFHYVEVVPRGRGAYGVKIVVENRRAAPRRLHTGRYVGGGLLGLELERGSDGSWSPRLVWSAIQ